MSAVTVTAAAWAEIEQVWARDGLITLTGSLQGADPDSGPWRLRVDPVPPKARPTVRSRLHRRIWRVRMSGRRSPGPYDVVISGGRFHTTVPVNDLVLPRPLRSGHWRPCLVGPDGSALRLGRHLGVPRRARVITFPGQRTTAHGPRFRVRPYYTADNHLAIGSRRAR